MAKIGRGRPKSTGKVPSRFGTTQNASECGRLGGLMRGPLRRLAAMEINLVQKGEDEEDAVLRLGRMLAPDGRIRIADLLAIRKIVRSARDDTAYERLCDAVEGKIAEKRIEAQVSLNELITGSYEGDPKD